MVIDVAHEELSAGTRIRFRPQRRQTVPGLRQHLGRAGDGATRAIKYLRGPRLLESSGGDGQRFGRTPPARGKLKTSEDGGGCARAGARASGGHLPHLGGGSSRRASSHGGFG